MLPMNQMLEFIDRLCLDEKLYWRIPLLAEVSWRRDARPAAWQIRIVGQEEWQTFTKAELPKALERLAIDPIAFDRQVGASILTQAVFADMVMEGAIELFGQEAVRKSIADTRAFLSGVSEAAKRMTQATAGKELKNSSARPTRPARGMPPKTSPSANRANLRLV
jgi:hypothetical protein